MKIIEKKHRLPKELYEGEKTVAFTACIKNRTPAFCNSYVVRPVKDMLEQAAVALSCQVLAVCFMPDHVHFILAGTRAESNCLAAVRLFKQKSGYWFSKKKFSFRWQKDFYDHILRKDEDLIIQIRYMMDNPVRKGLVGYWQDHPYCWSVYDLE